MPSRSSWATETEAFSRRLPIRRVYTPRSVAVGDFNNDGILFLSVANDDSSVNTVSILLVNGDGTFKPPVGYPVGHTAQFVTLGDIYGDGALEVLTANSSNTVSILHGKG